MFEVTGADIARLSDGDLRTLVARLAVSELRRQGGSLSSVTAGGNQDAADGGLDVRVESSDTKGKHDFVPRSFTGFQVKKSDMPASAIRDEMRPEGVLRPVIGELAAASGAYVIVSAQGSVADKPLAGRRQAMRDQLHDLSLAAHLHTDFYDRDRLATWANEHPGIAAWIRSRIGLELAGWSSVGDWAGTTVSESTSFLVDEKACLIDERSSEREQLTIEEGILRLRAALRTTRQCVRLIGLSGLGKTRLVQALFESGVGEDPLDPGVAVYTDYSVETRPAARDMARQLVLSGQRAILIVDNCNPATHSELARICAGVTSSVSLLTVEYDVGDDEPEGTEVFRLQAVSSDLVSKWLAESFPGISQVDRHTIADFSDGNFRVARALAETLSKGESLGKLRSRDLFERIFHQRNEPDQSLLLAAGDLALLYSVDGEDTSDKGELALVGSIRAVGSIALYEALATLRSRGIVQTRGRWRAVLPHAIANPLAARALERIPPAEFDRFCGRLTPRMQKSLARRLGYLHDSVDAQEAVARWLSVDGPLGDLVSLGQDGIQVLANIAPVAPEAVLEKIENALEGTNGKAILAPRTATRWQWIRLIKSLAYEPHLFGRAALLLARFLAVEPEGPGIDSARESFAELFHLHLSGTRASPEQRRELVRLLAGSSEPALRRCAAVALEALLKAHHFSSSSTFEFGARSRDWGWQPTLNRDVWHWYDAAIELAVELAPFLGGARDILARNVRDLWYFGACHDSLEHAATVLTQEKPWIEGWLSFRAALRLNGEEMPDDVRDRLLAIIQRLKPSDLLHRARAVVLQRATGGWDIADGEADDGDAMHSWRKASEMAQDVGRALAHDPETRKEFLAELLPESNPQRAFECGRGLAEGAEDLTVLWDELTCQFRATDSGSRNPTVLGGFMYEGHKRDSAFALAALDSAVDDGDLRSVLPYLQARIGIDVDGIARLRRAIASGAMRAGDFFSIASGVVEDSPPRELGLLLRDIAMLPDGVEIALDILHMHFYRDRDEGREKSASLVEVGRDLLRRADFGKRSVLRDFGLHTIIRICCSGVDGEDVARDVCTSLREGLESVHVSSYDFSYTLKVLFEIQPFVAMDVFLLPGSTRAGVWRLETTMGTPLDSMDPSVLRQWADRDGSTRYPLLGRFIRMFRHKRGDESNELNPLYLQILEYASDKRGYLGNAWDQMHPSGWAGSLAEILVKRRGELKKLRESPHLEVRQWVDELLPELDRWIEAERKRDRDREESFE